VPIISPVGFFVERSSRVVSLTFRFSQPHFAPIPRCPSTAEELEHAKTLGLEKKIPLLELLEFRGWAQVDSFGRFKPFPQYLAGVYEK